MPAILYCIRCSRHDFPHLNFPLSTPSQEPLSSFQETWQYGLQAILLLEDAEIMMNNKV